MDVSAAEGRLRKMHVAEWEGDKRHDDKKHGDNRHWLK